MPIVFEPAAPIRAMENAYSAAASRGGGGGGGGTRIVMGNESAGIAADALDERAREFDETLNFQRNQLTQAEDNRRQRLQRQLNYVQENGPGGTGQFTSAEVADMTTQLQTGLNPYQMRLAQQTVEMNQMRMRETERASARAMAIQGTQNVLRQQMAAQQQIDSQISMSQGELQDLDQQYANGELDDLDYATQRGDLTRAIRDHQRARSSVQLPTRHNPYTRRDEPITIDHNGDWRPLFTHTGGGNEITPQLRQATYHHIETAINNEMEHFSNPPAGRTGARPYWLPAGPANETPEEQRRRVESARSTELQRRYNEQMRILGGQPIQATGTPQEQWQQFGDFIGIRSPRQNPPAQTVQPAQPAPRSTLTGFSSGNPFLGSY